MDGIWHRTQLLSSDYELAKQVASGRLLRVRKGWYASPVADPEEVRAVRVGGLLTCVSLARAIGLWTVPDVRLHVCTPGNASRSREPDARVPLVAGNAAVVRHWGHRLRPPNPGATRDSIHSALAHLVRCQPTVSAVVTLDSALNRRAIDSAGIAELFLALPERFRDVQRKVDGSSQSGLETMCRLALAARGLRVRTQVTIEGVGAVDVVVGDRLVIELDGGEFHSGPEVFANDRRRDLELARRGYRVLRLSFGQVMSDWDACEAVILRLVRAGEHRWRPSSRRYFE